MEHCCKETSFLPMLCTVSYHRTDPHILVFFSQAEDGIRDYKVTGVQTCALPISSLSADRASLASTHSRRSRARAPRTAGSEVRRVGEDGSARSALNHVKTQN